jgi:DHA1 family multidrug resistance protein-like MFS transporter
MASFRVIQIALFFSIFYFVLTEVALSPFYPQFFDKVFGIKDLQYTAFYIFVARLTVVIAAPIWGLLARRYEVKHLLYIGQWISATMLLGMASSTSANQFLIFTIFLLIGKSSFLLIYPLLIQLNGVARNSSIAGKYHAMFHLAIILGTLVGALVLELEAPLTLFYALAVLDVFLWLLCFLVLRGVPTGKREEGKRKVIVASEKQFGFLVAIGLVIVTFHIANNMIRPYFTTYTIDDFSLSVVESSIFFILPSFLAIIAYPFIKKVCVPERLSSVYIFASFILMMSLVMQGMTNSIVILLVGRVLYGFFLAIAQASLELYLFQHSSENRLHMNYTIATSFQNGGLLAAPLLASAAVASYGLHAPLVIAAVICALNILLARVTVFRTESRQIIQSPKAVK